MSTVAITGLSGEIGSSFVRELGKGSTTVVDLFHSKETTHPYITSHVQFDLLESSEIQNTLQKIHPDTIVHLAGATHIDTCEADKINGKDGRVWQMNVSATEQIAQYCAKQGTHLIYLSTECVFNGAKKSYLEDEQSNPKNWYGETKVAAENLIRMSGADWTIIRAVIAYHPLAKNTLWQKIIHGIETKGVVHMADDHFMTPTYLSDISSVLDYCVRSRVTGTYHVAPLAAVTPFEFAQKIAIALGYSKESVVPTKLSEILGEERANLRLQHACLNSEKTQKTLKMVFQSIEDVLKNV